MKKNRKSYMHAERDLTLKVENHVSERVDRNKIVSVGGVRVDETILSMPQNIGHNMTTNVGVGAAGRAIIGELASSIFGISEAGYFVEDLASLSSGGGQYVVNASGCIGLTAGEAFMIDLTGYWMSDVSQSYICNFGNGARVTVAGSQTDTAGKVRMMEAHENIHLRCSLSEFVVNPDGTIEIKGSRLLVEEETIVKITAAKIELN